jgi:predicted cytidylate kinase
MIITITGFPGSGKSTIGRLLAQRLGWAFYSMGDLRGKMATERGMTIDELNALGEKQDFTDKEVDAYQKKLGETEDNFVVDGRLSWYFIPHAFKIYLTVHEDIGAKRIFEASHMHEREDEPRYRSVEDARRFVHERIQSDAKRYRQYYGVDLLDLTPFTLVLDTSNLTQEQVLERILQALSV